MCRFGKQTFHRKPLQPPSRQNCTQCRRVKTDTGDKTASHKQTVKIQGGSNMTGTDLCVNKLHCAAAVRP